MVVTGIGDGVLLLMLLGAVLVDDAFNDFLLSRWYPVPVLLLLLLLPAEPPITTTEL